jgi:hypothetical protein
VGGAAHVLPKSLQNALRNTNVDGLLSVHQHVTTAEVVLQLEALKEAPNADAFAREICHLVRRGHSFPEFCHVARQNLRGEFRECVRAVVDRHDAF